MTFFLFAVVKISLRTLSGADDTIISYSLLPANIFLKSTMLYSKKLNLDRLTVRLGLTVIKRMFTTEIYTSSNQRLGVRSVVPVKIRVRC